jgi:superfamily I DNA and/or RNA helicase
MMLEVRGMAQKVDNSYVNRVEAMSALSLVDLLVDTESAKASEITLLCLYKAQAKFLQAWEHKPEGLGVATLDAFQGRENQIILFLTTRMVNSSSAEAISFLDRRRWNVALSRCKKGVVVMTQKTALEKNKAAREWWRNEEFPFLPTAFTNLEAASYVSIVRSVVKSILHDQFHEAEPLTLYRYLLPRVIYKE